ncbi:LysR family transcriptional regulator [Amycolatopsis sp. lyj-90]|uniref:LysR family transcriptional regulator n=1 Tax=Amycolatopsis sp. lyj-90 TaxID=2789285 RepID=UPI00397D6907
MELKQLRYFLAVAEELHFSRAAQRVGITQPALSSQIQQLENELEVVLINRTSRQVSLTEYGEALLSHAQHVLAASDSTVQHIRDMKLGANTRLKVGTLPAGANGPLPAILRRLQEQKPGLLVELYYFNHNLEQERKLLSGELDVSLLRTLPQSRRLATEKVFDESFSAYLPLTHPLSRRERISLAELHDSLFIWPSSGDTGFRELTLAACRRHGFAPKIGGYADSIHGHVCLAAAGLGVSVVANSNTVLGRPDIAIVPLDDGDIRASLHVAYRKWDESRPEIDSFLQCLRELRNTFTYDNP